MASPRTELAVATSRVQTPVDHVSRLTEEILTHRGEVLDLRWKRPRLVWGCSTAVDRPIRGCRDSAVSDLASTLGRMSMQGLSDLLVAIMAAGDVATLDAHDPRFAHRAIVSVATMDCDAARDLLGRLGVDVRASPDPDVGMRVKGLTSATWQAVARGLLKPHEAGHCAWYTLQPSARASARRETICLDLAEADVLQRVGAAWASASTARKNRASAGRSPAPTRVVNLA